MLTELVLRSAQEPMRQVQKARFHLQFARPEETAPTSRLLGEELAALLDVAGASGHQAGVVLSALDGFILRATTYGVESLPPAERISVSLARLMRAS